MKTEAGVAWAYAVLAIALAAGCEGDAGQEPGVDQRAVVGEPSSVEEAPRVVRAPPAAPASVDERARQPDMPPALWRSFVAATMAEAGPEYAVRTETVAGSPVLVAQSPRQGVRAEFRPGAVRIGAAPPGGDEGISRRDAETQRQGAGDDRDLELVLAGVGRGNKMGPVGEAAPRATGNRVEYRRDGLTEWYLHGPLGL